MLALVGWRVGRRGRGRWWVLLLRAVGGGACQQYGKVFGGVCSRAGVWSVQRSLLTPHRPTLSLRRAGAAGGAGGRGHEHTVVACLRTHSL